MKYLCLEATRRRKGWRFKLIIESHNFFDIAVLMSINYFLYCTSVSKLGHQQHAQSYQPAAELGLVCARNTYIVCKLIDYIYTDLN